MDRIVTKFAINCYINTYILIFNVMKVKSSIKKRTADCKLVRRFGRLYSVNKKNPKYKCRQG